MLFRCLLLPLLAVFAIVLSPAAKAASPEGLWLVEDQTGRIKIQKCGGQMWGFVGWQKAPKNDTENPNPARHGKPLVGTPILIGMKPVGEDRYEGDIYNPRNGKVYKSKMVVLPSGKLQIKGCVLGGLICGGEDWVKLPEDPAINAKVACANAQSPLSR